MQRLCSLRPRIAVGAAISLVLLVGLGSIGPGEAATAFAIAATPSPMGATSPTRFVFQPAVATPTPIVQPGIASPIVQPAGAGSTTGAVPAVVSPSQQTSEQIASISAQVTQAMQDPTLSADARVQRINTLATQFNQLVVQWQQQIAQDATLVGATVPATCVSAPCVQQPTAAGGSGVQQPPSVVQQPSTVVQQNPGGLLTPTPLATGGSPTTSQTADQLRAQIAAISQQMAQVSQDQALAPDVRNVQLRALSTQFNQLMLQLQQLGG